MTRPDSRRPHVRHTHTQRLMLDNTGVSLWVYLAAPFSRSCEWLVFGERNWICGSETSSLFPPKSAPLSMWTGRPLRRTLSASIAQEEKVLLLMTLTVPLLIKSRMDVCSRGEGQRTSISEKRLRSPFLGPFFCSSLHLPKFGPVWMSPTEDRGASAEEREWPRVLINSAHFP